MSEVKCTRDYDLFKKWEMNRDVEYNNLMKIQRSMKKWGFDPLDPIQCSKDMIVYDGQHRLIAAKNLDLAVYYVVVDEMPDINKIRDMAHASKPWNLEDYITSNARQGNEHYKTLVRLKEISTLTWKCFLLSCLSSSMGAKDNVAENIKSGKFFITKATEDRVITFLSQLELFKGKCDFWNKPFFARAFSLIFSHKDYDHERMTHKLERQESRLHKCISMYYYVEMLQDIYNFQSMAKNKVDFINDLGMKNKDR